MGNTRSIRSEDFLFLEITMIVGEKYRNTRSIRSEDFLFLEITMILGKKREIGD